MSAREPAHPHGDWLRMDGVRYRFRRLRLNAFGSRLRCTRCGWHFDYEHGDRNAEFVVRAHEARCPWRWSTTLGFGSLVLAVVLATEGEWASVAVMLVVAFVQLPVWLEDRLAPLRMSVRVLRRKEPEHD